eukprot:CAMPEP_0115325524 /NCGR_PEP_ID=MMETSP0270-20121206/83058_1 /TAXON_ID=71861 /ORGANISM="Scrippsiella trochoidea, Strain CCMP3099" /LENGTH=97 /DNA_ID=CAMNT_0002745715 /DNA_START=47 /DNA_END=336 /DNA_ORIENTATION=+
MARRSVIDALAGVGVCEPCTAAAGCLVAAAVACCRPTSARLKAAKRPREEDASCGCCLSAAATPAIRPTVRIGNLGATETAVAAATGAADEGAVPST